MPRIETQDWTVGYLEAGAGPTVILLHASVSGALQWRALIGALQGTRRVVAINLFGYGQTTPWPGERPLRLADLGQLALPFFHAEQEPVSVVGHSLGGAVAMKLALDRPGGIDRLVLIEPMTARLLAREGAMESFDAICEARDRFQTLAARGDWPAAAEFFADFWSGAGTWASMEPQRRAVFVGSIKPNYHEWDAETAQDDGLCDWRNIGADALVMWAADTTAHFKEIAHLIRAGRPDWRYVEVSAGGHMFPATRPDLACPPIVDFLLTESAVT